ncbi:hypothetical protein Tco_0392534 [Tanacetum coccineum]
MKDPHRVPCGSRKVWKKEVMQRSGKWSDIHEVLIDLPTTEARQAADEKNFCVSGGNSPINRVRRGGRLWHLKKTTIIAEGTVYKSDGKIMLHIKALPKDFYKVSIDKSLVDAAFIPDVGSNGYAQTILMQRGFVQWPNNQVDLWIQRQHHQVPYISLVRTKLHLKSKRSAKTLRLYECHAKSNHVFKDLLEFYGGLAKVFKSYDPVKTEKREGGASGVRMDLPSDNHEYSVEVFRSILTDSKMDVKVLLTIGAADP